MAPDKRLAHHFDNLPQQARAARLGMWIFLAGEVLLFGGLFVAYALFRRSYPLGFATASHHLDKLFGTADTVILISSSFSMAMALVASRNGRRRAATVALAITVALGLGFIALHTHEYLHDIAEGALPGRLFRLHDTAPGAPLFFTLYYFMTGLHSLHVLFGAALLSWLAVANWRGAFDAEYDTPLELGGLYWHLVDLIWIFLYPLFYLV